MASGRQPGPIVMHSEKRVQVKEYQFDLNGIFKEIETQEAVYDQAARDNVATVVNGMNSTLMAYGQTGAGKTHAMFGPDEVLTDFSSADPAQYGMIPRALSQIFTKLEAMEGSKWTVTCSFCELYLDRARDLLGQEKDDRTNRAYAPERQIRLGKQGFFIEHLKQVPCKTVEEAMALIKTGSKLRMVAEMNMNKRSSRGHAIFTIQVIRTVERAHFTGQLHLVDLAGMESAAGQEIGVSSSPERREETRNINKSLVSLAQVVAQLSKGTGGHVPWRDSRLTQLLQSSLGGNSRSAILVCLRAEDDSMSETIASLRFAVSARGITTTVLENKSSIGDLGQAKQALKQKEALLSEREREIRMLKAQLEQQTREMMSEIEAAARSGKASPRAYALAAAAKGGIGRQGSMGFDVAKYQKATKQLRDMKLKSSVVTTEDLSAVMLGALGEALGGADSSAAKAALSVAVAKLDELKPADLSKTFPFDNDAWSGPAGYMVTMPRLQHTDWQDTKRFETAMQKFHEMLTKKITPTKDEEKNDLFLSHDFGKPADRGKPTNEEKVEKIKGWLTKHNWKVVSSERPPAPMLAAGGSSGASQPDTNQGGAGQGGNGGEGKKTKPENEPGHWDFMISYTQKNKSAQLMAQKLFYELSSPAVGHTVWLDVNMENKNETAMQEAVENSKVVIALITEGPNEEDSYFNRPFCVKELKWALAKEKQIQPVVTMEDKTKISNFIKSAPEDLKSIGSIDFVDLNMSDMDYFRVGLKRIRKVAGLLSKAEEQRELIEAWEKKTSEALDRSQLALICLTKCYMDEIGSVESRGAAKEEWLEIRAKHGRDHPPRLLPLALEKFSRALRSDFNAQSQDIKEKVTKAVSHALNEKGADEQAIKMAVDHIDAKFKELHEQKADEAVNAARFDEALLLTPPEIREAYETANQQLDELQKELSSLSTQNEQLRKELDAKSGGGCALL